MANTIEQQIAAGFVAAANADRALRTLVTGLATGDLTTLTTSDKSSLIAAINELEAAVTSLIDDTNASSTTTTYSASKIEDRLAAIRDGILGGASAAYDTLQEIQTFLQNDDTQIAALLTSVGNKVDYSTAQTLTSTQQTQARNNISAASQADLATANSNISANTSAISALGTRMTTAEGNITANTTLLTNAAAFDYAGAFTTALNA